MATLQTDDTALVGTHCFERAGLGKAPFRLTDFSTMMYQASPDAPVQPGGTCDYCGTPIMYACHIRSLDGKTFKVGCDCVQKTGDAGLIKAYKSTPAYRAHQKALREAKNAANYAEIERLLADESFRATLEAQTFMTSYGKETTMLEGALKSLPWCGAKGRNDWLKTFRHILRETQVNG